MRKTYVLLFVLVLTIPIFLGVNAWMANECGQIRYDIKKIEKEQEICVEDNRSAAAEIADLLSVDRIENEAQKKLGFKKINPENVTLIIVGGKGRGY